MRVLRRSDAPLGASPGHAQSMFDDCKLASTSCPHRSSPSLDIEHAGQPSVPGQSALISPGSAAPTGLSFQAGGLDPVEFEGFEQDGGDDGMDNQQYGEEEEAVEMEAVSGDTASLLKRYR